MRVVRRALMLVMSRVLVHAPALMAQGVPAPERMCDMSMRAVTVRLLTRGGAPIADASIEVRRVQRRTLVREARALGSGNYQVIEDGALADLKPGGEPFDLTFRRRDRLQRVRLIIGMDAARCHVALKAGRTTIRL